ncbi:uncharacterized protein LOC111303962 [Durio zibethinus]|uniref:Uncharacterized protein LOC111303962 n=1 Tax=Durio zibethinus TaxID=66656 RepID=A0A6P5ZUP9_DURZI|nr:uncharacterized protein LOC111303962 [Durio zibethinus]
MSDPLRSIPKFITSTKNVETQTQANADHLASFLSFPSLSKPTPFLSASLPQTLPSSSSSLPHKPVLSLNSAATFNNVNLDPRFLSCCMPDKCLKVAVLLSGGVDSSVALCLLHAAGHSCTAFYLKIWFQPS